MIRLGSIIAWVAVIFGFLIIGTGFFVALQFPGVKENLAASARYLATTNSGDAIDQGIIVLIVGFVIGIFVKIAKRHDA
ncbi:hypothetical protein [Ruegeria arenilitoris]|uniref:hypothetical protein n=1 Tax=Ruegeria arenilitoris TaxID=1173585 RepID=UPI00148194DC|nr:hypothetical protein [Ruegeria arenilitoris]